MSERNYWVFCDSGCKFPAMTSEQILAAIAEATGNTPTSCDNAFITKIREKNSNADLTFWVGTQAEYNAIETKENNCFYIVTDEETGEDIAVAITALREAFTNLEVDVARNETAIARNETAIARNETAISEHKAYTSNAGLGVSFYDNTNTSGIWVSTLDEVNALTKNGWYGLRRQGYSEAENIRDFGADFNYATIHVLVVTSKDFYQYLYIHPNNNNQCVHRRYKSSTMADWSPWEHIDPPMVVGTEYRTTERFLGKPVYVQLFKATMGDTSINTKIGTGTVGDVVDLKGMLYDGTGLATYKVWDPDFPLSYSINSGTISLGETVPNYSDVYITMKYTKN